MTTSVWTNRYNIARTGANTSEKDLNTTNVKSNQFGKLFTRTVDGQVYAQPLVIENVQIPGKGARNVLYICTSRNWVYAYDAEDPEACVPFWQKNLGTPVQRSDFGPFYFDFTDEIGITSTPVIDTNSGVMYLAAKTKVNGVYFYNLHALDIKTGDNAVAGSPAEIRASVPGTGAGSQNGIVTFDPKMQHNRPGLLLMNGIVYLGFASHGDRSPYHGWVLAYDAAALTPVPGGVFCTTPGSEEGGIWQSGTGLVGDSQNNIYCVTGNGRKGHFDFSKGPDFGCNIIKLSTANGLTVTDWFTPFNVEDLNRNDLDLCGGPVLLPGTDLVLGCGKDGNFYLVNKNGMGHFQAGSNSQIVQQLAACQSVHPNQESNIHGAPVFWDSPNHGPMVYVWGEEDHLRAYRFSVGQFQSPPQAQSSMAAPDGMPGGMLAVSADGSTAGTGILWAAHPFDQDANHKTVRGILRAFDASDISQELWNSEHNPSGRDSLGNFAKFCPPTVANGKVYMATFSREVAVYGLLSAPNLALPGHWQQTTINSPVAGSVSISCDVFTVLGAGRDIWDAADAFEFVHQAVQNDKLTITARVQAVQNTNAWAKAGVMIRQSLDPGSPHAMVVLTPGNGAAFQHRDVQGGISFHVPFTPVPPIPVSAPFWVRLARERAGANFGFTGFVSSDGVNWQTVGNSVTTAANGDWQAGLAVTSHADTPLMPLEELNLSVFDMVTIQ